MSDDLLLTDEERRWMWDSMQDIRNHVVHAVDDMFNGPLGTVQNDVPREHWDDFMVDLEDGRQVLNERRQEVHHRVEAAAHAMVLTLAFIQQRIKDIKERTP